MQNKRTFWCLLQRCLFYQHHPTTRQLKVNMEVFPSLYLHPGVHAHKCRCCDFFWYYGVGGGVNKRIPKFFQVFVEFVPVHQISGKSLHIVQMSDQKWARKIVQLNIIQINAQPLEFRVRRTQESSGSAEAVCTLMLWKHNTAMCTKTVRMAALPRWISVLRGDWSAAV